MSKRLKNIKRNSGPCLRMMSLLMNAIEEYSRNMKIKIKSLGVDKLTESSLNSGYLYKDLALDLRSDVSFNNQLNKNETLRDFSAIFDIEAVKNSIKTAFLTSPGENLLDPKYGVDIKQYIFEPVDDFTAEIIKEDILSKLPIMEPRIVVNNVEVVGNEDQNQYDIYLTIDVPSLNVYGLSIKSELSSGGYVII